MHASAEQVTGRGRFRLQAPVRATVGPMLQGQLHHRDATPLVAGRP